MPLASEDERSEAAWGCPERQQRPFRDTVLRDEGIGRVKQSHV